ncbi:MAG: GNAT family N-acetyltransferase [Candidatus Bathyarchaeia archaeon]
MSKSFNRSVKIVELKKGEALPKLKYSYVTSSYYDLSIHREAESWKIELALKPLESSLEKSFDSEFFREYVDEPRVFAAVLGDEHVGWVELGYHSWNSRMRVWEFLVRDDFRRKSVGTLLMNHAVEIAEERGARMLALEAQTYNATAINFYLRFGFELTGFDATAYSNEDIKKKEVRLEFGLPLQRVPTGNTDNRPDFK